MRAWLAALLLWGATGCIELTQVAPGQERLPAAVAAAPEPTAGAAFLGLELEEVLQGSLEDLEFLAGLRVVRTTPGSPAARAGLGAGDLLVKAGGLELQTLDQWEALRRSLREGERLRLAVSRDLGLVEVEIEAGSGMEAALPAATRFLERRKARVVVETDVAAGGSPAARIEELPPDSPLAECGLQVGDRITSLDGEEIAGARDLVERLEARPFGARVTLGFERDGVADQRRVGLWAPPRRITGLAVPILFHFDRDLSQDRTSWELVDLWLISLFGYERDGATRKFSLLRFFRFETGTGELQEVPGEHFHGASR